MTYLTSSPTQKRQDRLALQLAEAFHDTEHLRNYLICCRKYSPDVIQKAFAAARTIPEARIKKSRTAVFFYFIKRYAHKTS